MTWTHTPKGKRFSCSGFLAGFVCYALPFGSVSSFSTVEFNGWEYIYRMIQYSMYRDLTFWVILIPVILLVIETVFLVRVDLRLLESAPKYNDTHAKISQSSL